MTDIFLHILQNSLTSCFVIAAVLILRLLLRKSPKKLLCLLWLPVAIRLLLPISLESPTSLIPESTFFTSDKYRADDDIGNENILIYSPPATPTIIFPHNNAPIENDELRKRLIYTAVDDNILGKDASSDTLGILSVVWLAGIFGSVAYAAVSCIMLKKRLSDSIPSDNGVRLSEKAVSPFIFGFFKPHIYLPFGLDDKTTEYVIAHEKAHLARRDHVAKPFAYLLCATYWFNPLVWVSYILFCRDIELACDEKVIRGLDTDGRKEYALALLECGVEKKGLVAFQACPIAFGEIGIKHRVKNVMSYRKPTIALFIACSVALAVISGCFLTDPMPQDDDTLPSIIGSNAFDSVKYTASGTDYDGDGEITFELKDASVRSESPYLSVRLNNGTSDTLSYGREFHLYYIDEGKLVDCDPFSDDRIWLLDLKMIFPKKGTDLVYEITERDLSRAGRYRLEQTFSLDSDTHRKEYTAWIEFELENDEMRIRTRIMQIRNGSEEAEIGYDRYSPIVPYSTCDISVFPGGMLFDILDIKDDTIEISLRRGNDKKTEFMLKKGETVTYTLPTEDGRIEYFFEICDKTAYSDAPAADDVSELPYYIDSFAADFIRADHRGDGAEVMWNNSIFPPSAFSSIEYAPLVKLENRNELDSFMAATDSAFGYEKNCPEFVDKLAEFDDAFFDKNVLFLTYVSAGSGDTLHYVPRIYRQDGYFRIFITRVAPEVGTADMAGWFGIVTLDKYDIENCVNFDAVITSKSQTSYCYQNENELAPATLTLTSSSGKFHFFYSLFSSEHLAGTYEWHNNGKRLELTTYTSGKKYYFDVDGETLIFDAKASAKIPEYKYSTGADPVPAVPDRARFDKVETEP